MKIAVMAGLFAKRNVDVDTGHLILKVGDLKVGYLDWLACNPKKRLAAVRYLLTLLQIYFRVLQLPLNGRLIGPL